VAKRYEETGRPRFAIESVDGAEQIRIKARRSWLVLGFLLVWITAWSFGGAAAAGQALMRFDLFLMVWLVFWAFGWIFVAITIAWQLAGAETLRVVGGDLEIGHSVFGLARRRLFRGSEIRRLSVETGGADIFSQMHGIYPPFLSRVKSGSVKFDYGARTIRAASGLDEAEARLIVDHLRRRLPLIAADS
jgi:hypothetical protein